MVRGLFGISCLMAAGGCVALNSGFEESGGGTGGVGSSDTEQRTTGESDADPSAGKDSSAVTTVTAGGSSGGGTTDATDSSGAPGAESGHSDGTSGTSLGESGESGVVDCPPSTSTVTDDAFLQTCFEEGCAERNYGQRSIGSLADDEESSVLLLRVPNPSADADQIELTLHLFVEVPLGGDPVTITAYPINAPCEWSEGPYDGLFLEPGDAGVTYLDCNGDPNGGVGWTLGEEGTVWDNIDPGWNPGEHTFDADALVPGEPFEVTIVLERPASGPTPTSIAVEADIQFLDELLVFSSESEGVAPVVTVFSPCR